MPTDDTAERIIQELAAALSPLAAVSDDARAFSRFMHELGWDCPDIIAAIQNLCAVARVVSESFASDDDDDDDDDTSVDAGLLAQQFLSVLKDVRALAEIAAQELPAQVDVAQFRAEFPRQLFDYLIVEYLLVHQPLVGGVLRLLGLLRLRSVPEQPGRTSYLQRAVAWEDLGKLFDSPGQIFSNAYRWGARDFAGVDFLDAAYRLAKAVGLPVSRRSPLAAELAYVQRDALLETLDLQPRSLVTWPLIGSGAVFEPDVRVGLDLAILPEAASAPPGIVVFPFCTAELKEELSLTPNLRVVFGVSMGATGGIALRFVPNVRPAFEAGFLDGAGLDFQGDVSLQYARSDGEPVVLAGSSAATRLQARSLAATVGVGHVLGGEPELSVSCAFVEGAVVVRTAEGDGFLRAVLGEGLEVPLAFELGYTTKRGLYFRGGAGLDLKIAVRQSIGPLFIEEVHLALRGDDRGLALIAAVSGSLGLGPFQASVQDIGVTARIAFDKAGLLGNADLSIGFKPPTGVGLAIDASVVRGGGFLSFDADAGQYAGVFELTLVGTVSIKAIALISTKLPNGEPGFALLILITAEGFTPLQLGMGFSLTGIGGLLALHRTIDVDVVRGGLRDGVLDSVLFVKDPVKNAPRIISTLNRIFPLAAGRFAIGPLAEISWGAPPIVKIRLALLLEVPQPIRIVLLAQLHLVLPDEKDAVVELHVDAVGVLDFGKCELALDASIHDSRLLKFALSGDLALRLNWGSTPTFLMSVGGFHPRFPQPTGLRKLERLTLALSGSENPRIVFEAYLALTSNSIQMGARVSVFAAAGGFGVDGGGSFDALIQWSPFALAIGFEAWVRIFGPTGTLLGARLALDVTGPQPWHITGVAEFTVLFVTARVGVDFRIGAELPPAPAESIDVANTIWLEISKPGSWQASLAAGIAPGATLASLNESAGSDTSSASSLILHPLATLVGRQRVAPLERPISRIGARRPVAGTTAYQLQVVAPAGVRVDSVSELFAPAQYSELSDDAKLSEPSFVAMPAGCSLSAQAAATHPAHGIAICDGTLETLDVTELEAQATPGRGELFT